MQLLLIQGAGEGAYREDKLLADGLQQKLGATYTIRYPAMPDEANAPYELWKRQIEEELDGLSMSEPVILAGHSVGASHLAKCLSEIEIKKPVSGVFLLAAPFWGGGGWVYEGYEKLELPDDTAARFPKQVPVFLYHSRDDEIVPVDHLALYARLLPQATVRIIDEGGHQLNNGLSVLVEDISAVKTFPFNVGATR